MKDATILSYETKVQKLQEKLTVLQRYLSQYDQEVLPRQASILKIAQLQYQEGEIGFLPFSQIQERIFEEQQSYLEQIKSFNQTVLELSYLTQKNK
jgi:cobalt-zinc-cadmium resistance protein CzcA